MYTSVLANCSLNVLRWIQFFVISLSWIQLIRMLELSLSDFPGQLLHFMHGHLRKTFSYFYHICLNVKTSPWMIFYILVAAISILRKVSTFQRPLNFSSSYNCTVTTGYAPFVAKTNCNCYKNGIPSTTTPPTTTLHPQSNYILMLC